MARPNITADGCSPGDRLESLSSFHACARGDIFPLEQGFCHNPNTSCTLVVYVTWAGAQGLDVTSRTLGDGFLRGAGATRKKTCRDARRFSYLCAHLAYGRLKTPQPTTPDWATTHCNGATDADYGR